MGIALQSAYKIIKHNQRLGRVLRTPLVESVLLNQHLGFRLLCKCENLQVSGAFKARGAFYKISRLMAQNPKLQRVVAISSGNHAQAVAMVCHYNNINSTIIMPNTTPQTKVARTKQWGAEVVLYDRLTQNREQLGREYCAKYNAPLVHPYDDYEIMAGQGTIGLELLEQCKQLGVKPDVVAIPLGGGGMVSGISTALRKYYAQPLTIWAGEPEFYDDFLQTIETGIKCKVDPSKPSLSDALLTPTPGNLTLPIVKKNVDKIFANSDSDNCESFKLFLSEFRQVAEIGGLNGLTCLLKNKAKLQGKTAIAVVSGGNIDDNLVKKILNG